MIKELPDVQKSKDVRGITINRVGVEGIKFPLNVATKKGGKVLVTAIINLYGSLRHQIKGMNLSRFEEVLMKWRYRDISSTSLEQLLVELRESLGKKDVEDVYAEIIFDYFISKNSPISKKESVMSYKCSFIGKLRKKYDFQLRVEVLTTSACPCSKAISKYNSHNQRSLATVTITPIKEKKVWLEDLISIVEKSSSCEIFPLLKRMDEKFVTEKMYENPKFVEDLGRDISLELQKLKSINQFKIKVVNQESIHPHDAVAYVARKLEGKNWVLDHSTLRS